MARPLRIEYEGASYHVMNRGNARRRVFHGDDGYARFVDTLGRAGEAFRVSLRAFCLMASHFHLYLATPEANLSRLMQSLLTAFTVSHNRRRRSSGHLFQRRFKAVLVEDEANGQAVGRYVHLRPGRQVLLYLACRHCRGRDSLTDLAARLGGMTVGSLSRSRQLMEQRLARHRALRATVARLEQTPCAGRESHDA